MQHIDIGYAGNFETNLALFFVFHNVKVSGEEFHDSKNQRLLINQ